MMDVRVVALFAFGWLAGAHVLAQNLAPNPSFESGTNTPAGWSLSGGTGRWEAFGHTGSRCVSVTGTGSTANSWQTTQCRPTPGRPCVVRFRGMSTNASGGTFISGFDSVNRDIWLGPAWQAHAFIAALPNHATNPVLRFGQWMVNGTAFFDDVEVLPVLPAHARVGSAVLGDGEEVRSGRYRFQSRFNAFGGNYARCLHEHTAGFNTDRWPLSSGGYVIYRHGLGGALLSDANVRAVISWYQSGELIVEAGTNGVTWLELGRAAAATNGAVSVTLDTNLPPALLPAPELFVRLRTTGYLQVNSYRFEASVAEPLSDAEGQSLFFELEKQSPELVLEPVSVFDSPTGKVATVTLRNTGSTARALAVVTRAPGPDGGQQWGQDLLLAPQASLTLPLYLPASSAQETLVQVEVTDTAQAQVLFQAAVRVKVSLLNDASFGWRLPAPTNCPVWWCEGTFKVGRQRPLPATFSSAVELAAARNEYEPFQLVLRPAVALRNLRVSVSPFSGPGGAGIAASNVELAQVEYVPVTEPTDSSCVPGDYPDPLVPLLGPFNAAAGTNHPLWITVRVPEDVPAGVYEAALTVGADGLAPFAVPVRLRVFDFTLSDVTHTETAYGVSLDNRWHNLTNEAQRVAVWDLYMQNCRRHRISPYSPHARAPIQWSLQGGQFSHDFTAFNAAMTRYLDEFKFNAFNLDIVPSSLGGYARFTPEYRALYSQLMGPILAHLREKGWLARAYCYWFDEPTAGDYPFVAEGMSTLLQGAPGLRRQLTEQPEPPLYGAVDLWAPVFDNWSARCQERQALGEQVWWYVCTGPKAPYPNNFIDHPAIAHRLRTWMAEKLGVTGELYWSATHYSGRNYELRNPWQDAMSIAPEGVPWGNGDGLLLYPPTRTPPAAPVLQGPLNSLRWELLREALEDAEYFWLLNRALAEAESRPGPLSPAALEGRAARDAALALVTSQVEFETDPQRLYAARRRLAEAIEALDDGAPFLVEEPRSQVVSQGGAARFSVEALGWPPPLVQWRFQGADLPGATNATLVLSNVTPAQAGLYSARVRNAAGTAISAAAELLVLQPPLSLTLIATGALWKYHDKGQDLGSGWRLPSHNDAGWSNGLAQLGYGDNDERTRINYGSDPNNRYPAAYFRRAFQMPPDPLPDVLSGRLLRDDGAVVYLNGVEVFRSNMPTGEVTYSTWASATVNGSDENVFVSFRLSPDLLLPGTNLVAVEVHQTTSNSSDLSFDLELVASRAVQTPQILAQPESQARWAGGPAVLAVSAVSATPMSYQWFFNAAPLPGATNAALSRSSLTPADAGAYQVVVSNSAGAVTSAVASLMMLVAPTNATLISTGALWKYFDRGQDLGTAWRLPGHNDAAWSNGWAQLGYGDGDERTVLSFGSNPNNKYPTTYFRRAFETPAGLIPLSLQARVLWDDGAVVYLNGVEVFRGNMPAGAIGYATWAAGAIGDADENVFHPFSLPLGLLQPGTNLLAVEVHQANGTSSDLSFDLELSGIFAQPPQVLAQPADQTRRVGQTAVLAVRAAGVAPLAYQWERNGQPLPGASRATLVLPNVSPADAGTYRAGVSNLAGMVWSSPAVLTVLPPPRLEGGWEPAGGGFWLRFAADGADCTVLVSTNLNVWTVLTNLPAAAGWVEFTDLAAASEPMRFYRLHWP
jgi:hypothetical protein